MHLKCLHPRFVLDLHLDHQVLLQPILHSKGGSGLEEEEEEKKKGGDCHLRLVEDTLVHLLPALELHGVEDGKKGLGEVEACGGGRLRGRRGGRWRRRR